MSEILNGRRSFLYVYVMALMISACASSGSFLTSVVFRISSGSFLTSGIFVISFEGVFNPV